MTAPTGPATPDPVSERREAMNNHLGSWNLEDAVPTGFGLEVVKKYVAGGTDIDEALERLKERYPAAGAVQSESAVPSKNTAQSESLADE